MYRKILVPLDGSKVAEGVLPHAKSLAYSEGAELILLFQILGLPKLRWMSKRKKARHIFPGSNLS